MQALSIVGRQRQERFDLLPRGGTLALRQLWLIKLENCHFAAHIRPVARIKREQFPQRFIPAGAHISTRQTPAKDQAARLRPVPSSERPLRQRHRHSESVH